MEEFFTYTNVFILILILVWVLLIVTRPELRREMLVLGVFSLFLLPMTFTLGESDPSVIEAAFGTIGLLELAFAFALAGIAGTIFHAITGKHYHRMPRIKRKRLTKKDSLAQHWLLRLFITLLLFVWIVLLFNLLFQVDLATSALIGAIMLAVYMISHRHDLLLDAVWSALLTGLIVAFAATFASVFSAGELELPFVKTGGTIASVPIDLLVWSIAVGLVLGPMYEFVRRLEVKK